MIERIILYAFVASLVVINIGAAIQRNQAEMAAVRARHEASTANAKCALTLPTDAGIFESYICVEQELIARLGR